MVCQIFRILSLLSALSLGLWFGLHHYVISKSTASITGVWTCLAEPSVTRIFYANGSYLEFGRATEYARKKKWSKDYILSGRYSHHDNRLSISGNASTFTISGYPNYDEKPGRIVQSSELSVSSFKVSGLTSRSVLLKPNGDANLYCKRIGVLKVKNGFKAFIVYQNLQLSNHIMAYNRRRLEKIKFSHVIETKFRILHKLNLALKNHVRLDIFWLFRLIGDIRIGSLETSRLISIKQARDVFSIRLMVPNGQLATSLASKFRAHKGVHVFCHSTSFDNSDAVLLRCGISRKPVFKNHVSLVSMPENLEWKEGHLRQLKQLTNLSEHYRIAMDQTTRSPAPLLDVKNALRKLKLTFPGVKLHEGIPESKDKMGLEYLVNYQKLIKFLDVLYKIIDSDSINRLVISVSRASAKERLKERERIQLLRLRIYFRANIHIRSSLGEKGMRAFRHKASLLSILPLSGRL